jgi:hypothetical protein
MRGQEGFFAQRRGDAEKGRKTFRAEAQRRGDVALRGEAAFLFQPCVLRDVTTMNRASGPAPRLRASARTNLHDPADHGEDMNHGR